MKLKIECWASTVGRSAFSSVWGAHAPRVLTPVRLGPIAPPRSRTSLRENVSARRRNQHAGARALPRKDRAFTLIELLVVITIIVILMGLLFPAFRGVQDQAKKTQAKNDLTQIVTAVNAFYAEYGKYPLATQGSDATFTSDNSDVMNTLRAVASGANASDALNPRKIVFITPPDARDASNPRSGVTSAGIYYDPWGKSSSNAEAGVYHIKIDGDYDNQIANPYSQNAGATPNLRIGVIAWSLGKDGAGGAGDKKSSAADDDVISWQ